MRIAFFSEVYWPMVSGVSLSLVRTVDVLRRRGHATRVYTANYPIPPASTDRREVHRSPSRPFALDPAIQWARPRLATILADLRAFRPDVVHVLTEFPMGRVGSRAARQLGVPLIASAHTDYQRYAPQYGLSWLMPAGWEYLRRFYGRATVVLAPTLQYARALQGRGIGHVDIWSRGVNAEEFHPSFRSEAFRARFGVRSGDPLVLYVGRLAPEKGIPELLEAWDALRHHRGSAQLVLVGSGLLAESLARHRPAGVHVTGVLRGRDLATAYASADLFAFPSRTETFGNVLLEAMASGLPAVAVGAGGVTDFAEDGVNALVADPRHQGQFQECLRRLLREPELRVHLTGGALTTARARDWDRVTDGLLAHYAARIGRWPVAA